MFGIITGWRKEITETRDSGARSLAGLISRDVAVGGQHLKPYVMVGIP